MYFFQLIEKIWILIKNGAAMAIQYSSSGTKTVQYPSRMKTLSCAKGIYNAAKSLKIEDVQHITLQ